jgi:MraZ protein
LRFRANLGERFVLTRGFDRCVYVFDLDRWQGLSQKFEQGAIFDRRKMHLQRLLYSAATEVTPDNQGRVAIPQELREWAGIEPNSEVSIVGCENRVEIWATGGVLQHLERGGELGGAAGLRHGDGYLRCTSL